MPIRFPPLVLVALAGCAASRSSLSPSTVHTWGTLREALRDGDDRARVDVASVAAPGVFGVGALAGLDGEITVADGVCWTSRVRDGSLETTRSPDVRATLLFAARVPAWYAVPVPRDLPALRLQTFVVEQAAQAGIDTSRPFPFLVDGELTDVHMHVLAGECAVRARMLGEPMTSPPLEKRFETIRARLVGIHARDGAGVITHHGEVLHMHLVAADGRAFTGHCDSAGVKAGAVLSLPQRWHAAR